MSLSLDQQPRPEIQSCPQAWPVKVWHYSCMASRSFSCRDHRFSRFTLWVPRKEGHWRVHDTHCLCHQRCGYWGATCGCWPLVSSITPLLRLPSGLCWYGAKLENSFNFLSLCFPLRKIPSHLLWDRWQLLTVAHYELLPPSLFTMNQPPMWPPWKCTKDRNVETGLAPTEIFQAVLTPEWMEPLWGAGKEWLPPSRSRL